MKKLMISLLLLAMVLPTFAKEYTEETDSVVYVFNPHWYLRLAGGYQYTIGETRAASLSSGTALLGAGYNFTPVWGLRLDVNAWQSRDGIDLKKFENFPANANIEKSYNWKWYYVAPVLDVTMDLTNLIGGYKHNRIVNAGIFAGIGANISFAYGEVQSVLQQAMADATAAMAGVDGLPRFYSAEYYEDGKTRVSPLGQLGAYVDFRLSDHWNLGAEVSGNLVNDKYNCLRADNPDWYINAMVSVRYNFGETSKKKAKKEDKPCESEIIEKIVEKEVITHDTIVEQAKLPLRVEIFFPISSDEVDVTEYTKIMQLVDYLKKYPESKVTITGHADKSTGTKAFNQKISEKRANIVKNELIKKYGISPDRIEAKAMGDTDEPYAKGDPKLNRVSICVAD